MWPRYKSEHAERNAKQREYRQRVAMKKRVQRSEPFKQRYGLRVYCPGVLAFEALYVIGGSSK